MTPGARDNGGSSALVPCLLLFLRARSRDEGELGELVRAFGLRGGMNGLDETLARLETDGLVSLSEHEPARVYRLTEHGQQWLATRAEALGESARLVSRFLERYTPSGPSSQASNGSAVR